jgi:hypothetical protein
LICFYLFFFPPGLKWIGMGRKLSAISYQSRCLFETRIWGTMRYLWQDSFLKEGSKMKLSNRFFVSTADGMMDNMCWILDLYPRFQDKHSQVFPWLFRKPATGIFEKLATLASCTGESIERSVRACLSRG